MTTFSIAEHWLPALINDDLTGLEEDEVEQLIQFTATLPIAGHWDCDEEPHFATDEISGLKAMCHDCRYIRRRIE